MIGIAMNKFGKWTACRERTAPMSPISLMGPMSPIWFCELSQKPSGSLWAPSDGAETQFNALLTAFNASVTDFITHEFQRLTDFNGL
jgi:hypothetical protein